MAGSQGVNLLDAFVGLGMDLTAYRAGRKQAEAEAIQTGAKIDKAISLKTILEDIDLGRKKMLILRDAGELVGSTLRRASAAGLAKSLDGVQRVLGGIKNLAGDVVKGFAIGIGIGSFQAVGQAIGDLIGFIPGLVEKGKQYGLVVDEISDATGATSEASSRLAATLLYLGAPVGSLIQLWGQMARLLDDNEEKLNAIGIVTRDGNGGLLNQVQILESARAALSRYGDGTAKAKVISETFGRGGLRVLVDYLKLTDEQFEAITKDAERMGLILPESVRKLAETSQRESNRLQNALTGLGVALFTTVGPQITAFLSALTEQIVERSDEITNAVASVISWILGLASALTGASLGIDSFSGRIQDASAVTSPYSARLAELRLELANLGSAEDKATDSTEAQRAAIQRQIGAVEREIGQLKTLEAQQERTYRKAIDGLGAQLDAQTRLLDAQDKAAARADRDLALTEALRQAKKDLFEAEAQRRADQLAGAPTDQAALDVAAAQQAVLEAQKAIADEAKSRAGEDRRAEIKAVKDYIASIAALLDEAESKKAALNTLRRREAVLEARRQAQLAAGDTVGAADTGLKIEALRTAELRAEEMIRNGVKESALEKQKSLLDQEKAAVKAAVVDQTAIRRAEIEKQIADLARQEAAWDKLTTKQKADLLGLTEQIGGAGGLSAALRDARDAGVEFGAGLKDAFEAAADALGGVIEGLSWIVDNIDKIGLAFRYLTDPDFARQIDEAGGVGPGGGAAAGYLQVIANLIATLNPFDKSDLQKMIDQSNAGKVGPQIPPGLVPEYGDGGLVGGRKGQRQLAFLHAGEIVLKASLVEKLDQAVNGAAGRGGFMLPAFPGVRDTLAPAGAGVAGDPAVIRLEIGGNPLLDYVDASLFRRRRGYR